MESRAPQGNDWADIVETLHAFSNMLTVRKHYAEGHPAIQRADDAGGAQLLRLLARFPDLVVAIIDGELVICERPFPDLRERLHILSSAMLRHEVECIVFQRGTTPIEAARLARALASPPDAPGVVRAKAQAELAHVLLRFAELRELQRGTATATSATYFVPAVAQALGNAATALAGGTPLDVAGVYSLAKDVFECCARRTFVLTQRCWSRSGLEAATHATNVALMSGAMALEAGVPETTAIDVIAAALLHDVGQLLLPPEIVGLPEKHLDERTRPLFRNHAFAGASALLAASAPPLWVAVAFEHHRGVDGGGYPALEDPAPPDPLTGLVALASFFDRKRTALDGRADTPEEVLRQAMGLEGRFFARTAVERFVRSLGVYPPGTTVELSDGQPALVLAASTDPWRPRVMVLRGPNGGTRADLTELDPATGQHTLSVVRAIPPPLLLLDDLRAEDPKPAMETAAASAIGAYLDRFLEPPRPPERPFVTAPPPAPSRVPKAPSVTVPPIAIGPKAPPGASIPPAESRYSARPGAIAAEEVFSVRASAPPATGRRSLPPPAPPKEAPAIASLRVPRRKGAVPASLDHRGAFVLTYVDGMMSVEDIVDATGLPRDDVLGILRELIASGAIELT